MVSLAAKRPLAPADEAVHRVRRFNRFYTRQIGLLQEHLLNSGLSLTEVRVLYELAHAQCSTAVELRHALGLDRGYLSRMLQRFEEQSWVRAMASPSDRRRLVLSLTAKGAKLFAPLDRKSSEEVAAMLVKLSRASQGGLLRAMNDIERILAPAAEARAPFVLRPHRAGDLGWVVYRHAVLFAEEYGYDQRFEGLVAEIVARFARTFDPAREGCWMAEKDEQVVGSVFLVAQSSKVAKLRLLLVEPHARGLGVGKALIARCIDFARQAGYRKIVLWTQSELHAARHLYRAAGFRRIEQKPHQSWGQKRLVSETWELRLA